MSEPINNAYNYVPPDFEVPVDPKAMRLWMTDYLKKIARALQRRDIGVFSISEIGAGLQYFPTTVGDWRNVWRKVINFGSLPNSTTKSVAHGITWTAAQQIIFTHIYATATDQTNFSAISVPDGADPSIEVDATNVNITTSSDLTAYTECYVVLEYLKVT